MHSGINQTLYEWALSSQLFKNFKDEDLLNKIFDKNAQQSERASIDFAKKIWGKCPELGPVPFFDFFIKSEYERSYYDNYRDHTTHQVKVFLLGAYMYEKCDTIQKAINDYLVEMEPNLKEERIAKEFITIWIAVALYHDIGYLVESTKASEDSDFRKRLIEKINEWMEYPLSKTATFSISKKKEAGIPGERRKVIYTIIDMEDNKLYAMLSEICERAYLEETEDNPLKKYYDATQKITTESRGEAFRDHGIASALLLLRIWKNYRHRLEEVLKNFEGEASEKMDETRKKVKGKVESICQEIGWHEKKIIIASGAIALHNLNKSIWTEEQMPDIGLENFTLDLKGDSALPIAFLLRLSDEIQGWDREYCNRPLKENEIPFTGADIDICAEKTHISLSYPKDEKKYINPATCEEGNFRKLKKSLLPYLNDDNLDEILRYKSFAKPLQLDIKAVHMSRESAHVNYEQEGFAKERCDIIAFGLENFRSNVGHMLEKNAKNGLKIRILTMQPDSIYVKKREEEEGTPSRIRNSIIDLLGWINEIKQSLPKELRNENTIEVKLYDSLPLDFYCRLDDKIYVGPYLAGSESRNMITYELEKGTLWEMYEKHFDDLWEDKILGIRPIDSAYKYSVYTQQEIIEQILEAFCNILTNFDNPKKKIRCITVKYLPGDEYRKTTFFWNKAAGSTNYSEARRSYGVAGKMDEYKRPYIHHFSQEGLGKYYYFADNDRVKSNQPMQIEESGGESENLMSILAAPIWNSTRETAMGIVTFEFMHDIINFDKLEREIEQCNARATDIKNEKKRNKAPRIIQGSELRKLRNVLDIANECASVLSKVIIYHMEVDGEKLFDLGTY